jgi:Fe-S-cluster containining protein
MNRSERKRQAKEDEKRLARGIDPESRDPEPTAAMARQLHALFEKAKASGSVDAAVGFFHAKVEATLGGAKAATACAQGCSHCCHAWVSATAPEILYVAKLMRRRGGDAMARVRAAYEATRGFDVMARARNPHPCPALEADLCTVYDSRPGVCRFASSINAAACERVLRLLQRETIPTPLVHMKGRAVYEIAMTIALIQAGLPHRYYEFNGGLAAALVREDAEAAWLAGEDVFKGVRVDPNDTMQNRNAQLLYRHAFGAETMTPPA